MKTLKNLLRKNKDQGIAEELTKSYAKVIKDEYREDNFKSWFANIIYLYNPINKQMFE